VAEKDRVIGFVGMIQPIPPATFAAPALRHDPGSDLGLIAVIIEGLLVLIMVIIVCVGLWGTRS
jgi:hypothetical protein